MTITIRNLTPHVVRVFGGGDVDTDRSRPGAHVLREGHEPRLTLAPSGVVARAAEEGGEEDGEIAALADGRLYPVRVPVYRAVRFARTVDLPAPAEGVGYVVSLVTADAARAEGRDCADLFVPADVLRDGAGRIVGCLALRRVGA